MKVTLNFLISILIFLKVSTSRSCKLFLPFNTNDLKSDNHTQQADEWSKFPLTDHEKAEDRLEWLSMRLKSFVHGQVFDILGFELSAEIMGQQVSEVEELVKSLIPFNSTLLNQLTYVKELHRVSTDLTELLKFYGLKHGLDQFLIKKIINLERIFA